MKFRDGRERDPEDYGYIVLTQKEVDSEYKKKKENPSYKKSLELVRKFNQVDNVYLYKLKLKDLDIGQGFHTEGTSFIRKLPSIRKEKRIIY